MKKIVFATNNNNKLREAREILGDKFQIVSLEEIGCHDEIPETAETLEGNSLIKANYIFERYHCDCFSDDTGLEIEALDGAPGVYTARFAGENCTPADNRRKTLELMKGKTNRNAKFRTVVTLVLNGEVHQFTGEVAGFIATEERGNEGFGYDPIFIPENYDKTFAELPAEVKNSISHRGRAMQKFAAFMVTL